MQSKWLMRAIATIGFTTVMAQAVDKTVEKKDEVQKNVSLEQFTVLGDEASQKKLTGSADKVSYEKIKKFGITDVNRALAAVPGVYVREEDGQGLFPNISLRGVDSNRSAKVTLMEDGVLTAPAPYSAPDAYYSPNMGRMSGLEIFKGSSQVLYGPHTTAGVINYLSTEIPQEQHFYLKQTYGSYNESITQAHYGDTFDLEAGKLGVLFEYYHRANDGFRKIQGTTKDTGIEHQSEPTLKLRFEPNTDRTQYFEFKIGYTDMQANETYLGLSDDDFSADPYERYWITQHDQINTYGYRTYFRHFIELTEETSLKTTAYYQAFHRNWHKLDKVGAGGTNPAKALAAGGADFGIINGTGAGDYLVKGNNRSYYLYGVQSELNTKQEILGFQNDITLGGRFHIDKVDRDQYNDSYTADGSGGTAFNGRAYNGGNRDEKTDSIATFLQDAIQITDALTITPGARVEHIRAERVDRPAGKAEYKTNYTAWSGGIGFNYVVNDQLSVFGGVHQGVSLVGGGAAAKDGVSPEKSLAKEIGLRYTNKEEAFAAQATFFHTDFRDLLITENESTGAKNENVGEATSYGLELAAQFDPATRADADFKTPLYASLTYTEAYIQGNVSSKGGLFQNAQDGNPIPYIPAVQFAVGAGIEYKRFGFNLEARYKDDVYTTAGEEVSTTDSRIGKTDKQFIVDAAAYYQVNDNLRLLANGKNILGEEYIASRHPHGARAGLPATFTVGVELEF